jgi:hypothetical protein
VRTDRCVLDSADSAHGKQFLFEFVRKRIERKGLALHLKVEFQPNCVQMAIRAEKFKAAMVVQDSTRPIKTEELEPAVLADSRMHIERARLGSLDDAIVTPASVADWLIKYVEPEYWDDVVPSL